MSKLSKADHQEILRLIDVEKMRTSAVASKYGVVPRTINIILVKMRASKGGIGLPTVEISLVPPTVEEVYPQHAWEATATDAHVIQQPNHLIDDSSNEAIGDFLTAKVEIEEVVEVANDILVELEMAPESTPAPAPNFDVSSAMRQAVVEEDDAPPVRSLQKGAGPRGNSGKQKAAYGLVTKEQDGEEEVIPYASFEDLLSSVKNVVRQAATRAEPVWFSVRPIDMSDFAQ